MAPAAVRFHPAAVQEAESTYHWYAARDPAAADGFRYAPPLIRRVDFLNATGRSYNRT